MDVLIAGAGSGGLAATLARHERDEAEAGAVVKPVVSSGGGARGRSRA